MLYIRKLEISDEQDMTVLKIKNRPLEESMGKIILLINKTDGKNGVKGIFRKFLRDLDNEFKEYFNMG